MTGADDKGATQSYPEQAYSALDKVKFDLIAVRESTRRLSWISRLCGQSTEVEDKSQAGSDLLLFLAEQQTGLCDRIWGIEDEILDILVTLGRLKDLHRAAQP